MTRCLLHREDILSLIEERFERALEQIQSRVFSADNRENEQQQDVIREKHLVLAVALSGGRDSTALLSLAKQYAVKNHVMLWAFHIHHGISSNANHWLAHCRQICQDLDVHFDALKVQVNRQGEDGIEGNARRERYKALEQLCRQHGVSLLLTAHHQNDQVETILMQLLRGTGLAGLAGMDECVLLPYRTPGKKVFLGRPLLNVSRQNLEIWLANQKINFIEDESNHDLRYTRNRIRHQLVPWLSKQFAGCEKRLSMTATHVGSALRLLDQLAQADWRACLGQDDALNIKAVRQLDDDRIDNLLRYWLGHYRIRIPSTAWFYELKKQLLETNYDIKTSFKMDGKIIRKYRDQVTMSEQIMERHPPKSDIAFNWNGEPSIQFRTWYGLLKFELGRTGFDVDWFRGRIFTLKPYYGAAKLKLMGRPSKDLKTLYQEVGISGENRQFLPAIWLDDQLIYAAGIGQAAQYQGKSGNCVQLYWERQF